MANEFKIKHGFISTGDGSITGGLTVTGAAYADNNSRVATRPWVSQYLTDNNYATSGDISTAISNLVDSAPGTLDTLNELAAALGDDPNFATTVTSSIATKLPLAGGAMTGDITFGDDQEGIVWSRNTDGAHIKFYNTSDADTNSYLNFHIDDNGNEDFLFTARTGSVTTELLRIMPDGGVNGMTFRGNTVWNAGNFNPGDYQQAGSYLTSETDTLATVTTRGDSTSSIILTGDAQSRSLYIRGAGNIIQFENAAAVKKWEVVGRDGTFYIYKNDGTGSGMKYQIDTSGNHTITGELAVTGRLSAVGYNDSNWNTAYSWGNHADEGYLTSYTETDTLDSVVSRNGSTGNPVNLSSSANRFNGHHYFDPYDSSGNHYPHYTAGASTGAVVNTRVYSSASTWRLFILNGKTGDISWDGNALATETFAAGAADAVNDRIDNEVLPSIPTNNNQLTNGAGYITDGNTGWNNTYGFITSSDSITGNAATATSATQVVTIQDTAPAGVNGKLWWESDTGKLKVYYGSSSTWVDALPVIDTTNFYTTAGGAISGDVSIAQTLTVSGNIQADAVINAGGGNSTNWNTAYSWGNHASQGYITDGNTNWNNTYGFITASDSITGNAATATTASKLTVNTNDTFSGTYPIMWHDGTTIYSSSWMTVRGSDDTLLVPNVIVSGNLSIGSISNPDGMIENTNGNYLHIGGWGVARTHSTAVLVNTAYRADRLDTARNIALAGDVTGSANFDGSANITITATIADDSHNHVISNIDGLQTALNGKLSTTGKAADSNLLDGIDSTGFVKQQSDGETPDYLTPSSRRVNPNTGNPSNEHYAITTFGNGGNVTGQLATHFQNGQSYLRAYNSSWSGWRKIWDDTNFNPASYLTTSGKAADSNLLDGINSSQFVRSDVNSVTIARHLDANTTWTSGLYTLFLGWNSGKTLIGNNADGGHDYASALGGNTIPIVNKSYFFKTAKFEEDIQTDGKLNVLGRVGTWITSDAMSDSIGWNINYGTYIGSNVGGTHYLRGNGTFSTGGSTYNLWHEGNFNPEDYGSKYYSADIFATNIYNAVKVATINAPGDAITIRIKSRGYTYDITRGDEVLINIVRHTGPDGLGPDIVEISNFSVHNNAPHLTGYINDNGDVWITNQQNTDGDNGDELSFFKWKFEVVKGSPTIYTSNFTIADINSVPQPRLQIDSDRVYTSNSADIVNPYFTRAAGAVNKHTVGADTLVSNVDFYSLGPSYFNGDAQFFNNVSVGGNLSATGDIRLHTLNQKLSFSNTAGQVSYISHHDSIGQLTIASDNVISLRETDSNVVRHTFTTNDGNYTATGVITASGGNSGQWNTAYSERNRWNGGSAGLNAATGRTSLGLGSAATSNTGDFAAASHSHNDLYYTETEINNFFTNYTPLQSGSDFTEGTLVKTNIDASGTNGDSFLLQVRGKSYRTDESPYDLVLQGYIYNNTFINASAINNGTYFPSPIKVLELDGELCFWWARGSYWNSFEVWVTQVSNGDTRPENRAYSISNSAEPSSSKKISVEPYHSWSTKDFSSGTVSNWNTAHGWGNHADAGYIKDGNTNWSNTYGFIAQGDTQEPGGWTAATKFKSSGQIADADSGSHSLQLISDNNNDAFMSLHVSGDYAVFFGLDGATNRLHTGGWSAGATSYQIWDSRDFSSTNISNWNTAHGWGDHATAGYITASGSITGNAASATQVVTIQDAAPGGVAGKLWWESDTGKLKVYYGSAWVDATPVPDMSVYYPKSGGAISGDVTIQQTLTVVGNTLVEGTLNETSDISLKENILSLEDSKDKVMQLRGVSFNKKTNPNVKEIGFIAQEVEEIIPELVTETDSGIKTVSYTRVTSLLVETVKEQQAEINELKDMVAKLMDKVNNL